MMWPPRVAGVDYLQWADQRRHDSLRVVRNEVSAHLPGALGAGGQPPQHDVERMGSPSARASAACAAARVRSSRAANVIGRRQVDQAVSGVLVDENPFHDRRQSLGTP